MNFIQRFLDDRKVDTLTVTITGEGKTQGVAAVMLRHKTFGDIVTSCNLELASTEAGNITLRGRRKNLRQFKRAFDILDRAGAV